MERSVSLSTNKFSQMANDVTKRYELSNADLNFNLGKQLVEVRINIDTCIVKVCKQFKYIV